MRIDIWSDVICPWCYLGKRRFERAVARLDWADEIEIRWRAFQLDPTATAEPTDLESAINRKYGHGAFASMTDRLRALGDIEGIDYRFDRARRVATFDAHRLLAWAWDHAGPETQNQLSDRLFLSYFTEGANVADHATLVEAAVLTGLDRVAAAEVLATGAYAGDVAADLAAADERGITGVPGFVVADRVLIPGAQEPDTLVAVLERARTRYGADPSGG